MLHFFGKNDECGFLPKAATTQLKMKTSHESPTGLGNLGGRKPTESRGLMMLNVSLAAIKFVTSEITVSKSIFHICLKALLSVDVIFNPNTGKVCRCFNWKIDRT
jgi:hypothetical protein